MLKFVGRALKSLDDTVQSVEENEQPPDILFCENGQTLSGPRNEVDDMIAANADGAPELVELLTVLAFAYDAVARIRPTIRHVVLTFAEAGPRSH